MSGPGLIPQVKEMNKGDVVLFSRKAYIIMLKLHNHIDIIMISVMKET